MSAEGLSVAAAFREGLRRGEDPVNVTVLDGSAITTRRSSWFGKYCSRCYHNFRLDDPVQLRVGSDGKIAEVQHDDRLVGFCGQDLDTASGQSGSSREFFGAIDACDPPRLAKARRLHPGDPLLQVRDTLRPRDRRPRCFACANSFRPYEFVLTCVCRPDDPQGCELSIHQDPAHSKPCYERWLQGQGWRKVIICPMDMRNLGGG